MDRSDAMNMDAARGCEAVTYRIDRLHTIVGVDEAWSRFARQNGAGESCAAEAVVGRSLWTFISGQDAQELYRLLLLRVAASGKAVVLPFRCDAPELRRFLELRIEPLADGGAQFRSKLLRTEARQRVALLDMDVPRADGMLRVCSTCKRVAVSETVWEEVEDAVLSLQLFNEDTLPALTHVLCPDCFRTYLEVLDRDVPVGPGPTGT
jgi:hypothetical protein